MLVKKDFETKKVRLFDNYYFRADESQFILCESVVRKSKQDQNEYAGEVTLGFYPSLQSLCKGLVKICALRSVSDCKVTSLKDVIAAADEVEKKLEAIVRH